ncbi:hypothetical protein SAMN05216360_10445 [Methylobacterium phyllostachyos]|uniref:4-amino-4-deoxy-L-arabinose transferase n=1 Tax=Methylobacterium phyllostachyos TaxID=582672 RepID=A0A1G9WMV8_9HYPH|nr:hypothetical protein [Methylobacterium phyllostachyos]SDM85563.1 hypothetical protein SAMN05216360_10445 [Methylobacterium phyllostachyos]
MSAPAQPTARPTLRVKPRTVLWVLAGLCCATMVPLADLWATIHYLRVPDTDDAMRLVEVRDLLAGQSWYDLIQHRFLAPAGVPSHWSRLIDAPIAGLILALTPLAGRTVAEGLAAALWPVLLFGVYGAVLYRGLRAHFGSRTALLALIAATQTLGLTIQFAAGRVDHHNIQIIAIVGLAFCLMRGGIRSGVIGGGLAALSLAVGLEGLPSIAVAALFCVGDWCWRGRPALPLLAGFGLGLGAFAPILFAAQTAPGLWTATRCDALSPPWLWLACCGLLFAVCAAASGERLASIRARTALAGLSGVLLLGGFALAFPVCLGGPFPDMPPLVRDHWLLTVNEMASLPKFIARGQWEALVFYPVVLLATAAASWMAWRGPHRRIWAGMALFLWPGLILGLFQFRGLYIASGFVPLAAGAVLDRALRDDTERRAGLPRWGNALLGGCIVSTLWMVPAILAEALGPATRTAPDPAGAIACRSQEALAPLDTLPPGTVLAPIFMGPAILLHTRHGIVAAPYHRAIPGLTAAIEGLGGTQADLERVLTGFRVRYLVACPARPAEDLQAETAFATRLAGGAARSDRLVPLDLPGPLKVWRVVPDALKAGAGRAG